MYPVCAGQIKAARAILGWSQEELAVATGLSVNTIRNIEMGYISPRMTTNNAIRKVIEDAGLEFTEGEGVKRRNDTVKIFQGPDSFETFLDDVAKTIRKKGGDIGIIIKSQDMLLRMTASDCVQHLEELGKIANVKCLICEVPEPSFVIPSFQFRMTSKLNVGPLPCFVYGDKYASILIDSAPVPEFVVFKLAGVAQSYQNHFLLLWENSQPLLTPVNRQQKQFIEA